MEFRPSTARASATAATADKIDEVKPRLRGWIHLAFIPILLLACSALIIGSSSPVERPGSSVYAASAVLLFTVSSIYHRGSWELELWAF